MFFSFFSFFQPWLPFVQQAEAEAAAATVAATLAAREGALESLAAFVEDPFALFGKVAEVVEANTCKKAPSSLLTPTCRLRFLCFLSLAHPLPREYPAISGLGFRV